MSPDPFSEFSSMKTKLFGFQDDFSSSIQQLHNQLLNARQEFQENINQLRYDCLKIESEMDSLKLREAEIEHCKEKEVTTFEDSKIKFKALQLKEENLILHKKALNERISALQNQVDIKQKQVHIHRQQILQNSELNLQEMLKFEKFLGLSIESIADDVLKFYFINVNPKDYQKEVTFILEIGNHYVVKDCQPTLEACKVKEIEDNFNQRRDLKNFLKDMRSALKDKLIGS
ncbi:BA75_04438T0 [Komagataella pastoris]|uniref:Kinetochore protein SPC25 n=1 Tax=Komagataella pastoris TaxID=4922 RepID=A0A1B2JHV0_PICPA|nr:BA75_04438T0 [Komagataella pastoris]